MADPIIGSVQFKSAKGKLALTVNPDDQNAAVCMYDNDGNKIFVFGRDGTIKFPKNSNAVLAGWGMLIMGPTGSVTLNGMEGNIEAGGHGEIGELILRDVSGKDTVHLRASDGVVRAGGNGVDGRVIILNKDNKGMIRLEGSNGDIILENADCAEDFDVADGEPIVPGSTMVLDADGNLRQSRHPYDRKVAGVLSGAGEFRPGIVLDRRGIAGHRAALAMVGKVCCRVDATADAIVPGDLLTTSSEPGHAMKATRADLAVGALLGKALAPMASGRGLIPILVALQ